VDGAKLASLGLRVRRGGSYHGLALNVAMDLEPFRRIDPCGYRGQAVTDLATLGIRRTVRQVGDDLGAQLAESVARLRGS
jgi:lipoyl(octanoyl) transferase